MSQHGDRRTVSRGWRDIVPTWRQKHHVWGLEEQCANKGREVPFPGDRRKYANMVTPTSDNEGVGGGFLVKVLETD